MKHYIIDGNNLLGKERSLSQLQKKNKQQSREKLAFILSRFFAKKKAAVSLHFDGHEREAIKVSNIKIIYSGNYSADDNIKREIEKSKNPRNIILITSDTNLMEFGRVCSSKVIKSEEFVKHIKQSNTDIEERIKSGADTDVEEFKKLFGIATSDK
ncbi:MAG: NYN domain-containing protein [bacterium]|nr:NYN domain-containing protein [bacterium]